MSKERRTQVEIGQDMVQFFTQRQDLFSLEELMQALKMNRRTVTDWLELYQIFNQGPAIRKIKVNNHIVYEVLHGEDYTPQNLGKVILQPTKGERRTKLQKGVALVAFLEQQEQAFFRSTLEEQLGMKPEQSTNWIDLYQEFNHGPHLHKEELETGLVVYRVEIKSLSSHQK